jgi:cell division protein FtsL
MTMLDAPTRPETTRAYGSRGAAALAPAPLRRPAPSAAPEDGRRHLRVVAPAERVRRRLTPALGVLLTAGLFALLFAVAIAHTVLVQGQIRLDAIDANLATEQARYQELRMEVAEMESPARVVDAAQQLGMVTPDDLVYLQPEADDVVGDDAGRAVVPGAAGALGDDENGAEATDAADGWPQMKPLLRTVTP